MPKKARPHPKPKRRRTYIRQWRKARDITLAKLSERLAIELEIEVSEGQLSRIERGVSPYNQDLLEAIAAALRCEPADLLMRDPSQPESIWSIWEQLAQPQQVQLVEMGKVLKKTGTDG